MNIDSWIKRIWLTIGILVLVLFVVMGVVMLWEYLITSRQHTGILIGPDAHPKGVDSLVAQDIVPHFPQRIGTTDLVYIGLHIRDLSAPTPAASMRIMKYSGEPMYPQANLVNIIISKKDGSGAHLLLHRKAFIKTADIPSTYDSLRTFCLYDIVFYDSNKDGRINEADSSQLYISDLDGEHLTQVIPDGAILVNQTISNDNKYLYVLLKQRPHQEHIDPKDWPERLYAYNITLRMLAPFPSGNTVYDESKKLIWGK
jgi:hypothetical protein